MAKTEVLVSMFTDIVGFTEKTAQQSRKQQNSMLADHDRLLLPLVRYFDGSRIKSVGDGMLLSFRSPTDALKCAMAFHDRLYAYNKDKDPKSQIHIRAALNVGEVQVERNDIFGDSVNIASRVEGVTPPGEVYFTQAVYLAMNKAEVRCEPIGSREFKGATAPVELYRIPTSVSDQSAAPYGGELPDLAQKKFANWAFRRQGEIGDMNSRRFRSIAVLAGAVAAVVLAIFLTTTYFGGPKDVVELKREARDALMDNDLKAAQTFVEDHVNLNPEDADGLLLMGHVQMTRNQVDEGLASYASALKINPGLSGDEELVRHLLSLVGSKPAVNALIIDTPSASLLDGLELMIVDADSRKRHSAARLLMDMGQSERIDRVAIALQDLKQQSDCEDRLKIIQQLGNLGSSRALPELRKLQQASVVERVKYLCYRAELKATIAQLEGGEVKAEDTEMGISHLMKKLTDSGTGQSSTAVEVNPGRK